MRIGKSGPRSNFLPSLSMALIVKMSSNTMLDEVEAMANSEEKARTSSRDHGSDFENFQKKYAIP
jgi:hypothetical protein